MKRKSHKKSRRGCYECKKAHSKCDEQLPRCFNCIRLCRSCTWPATKEVKSASQSRTQSPANSKSSTSDPAATQSSSIESSRDHTGLSIRELTLLHKYLTDASTTIGEVQDSHKYLIWSQNVVKLGLQYPFLLRAALSVAALRLAKVESNHEWFLESAAHIEAGLKGFRPLIANTIDDELQPALFAFSSLLVVQSFGVAMVERPPDPIEEFIRCMRLVRGVSVILKNAWESVQRAELGSILVTATCIPQGEAIDDCFLTQLKSMTEASGEHETDINALTAAIDQLQQISTEYSWMKSGVSEAYASSLSILLRWPVSIPERAIELMAERNPHALCMMAYFPRNLASSGSHWWLVGWDKLLLSAVVPVLPSELGQWLLRQTETD